MRLQATLMFASALMAGACGSKSSSDGAKVPTAPTRRISAAELAPPSFVALTNLKGAFDRDSTLFEDHPPGATTGIEDPQIADCFKAFGVKHPVFASGNYLRI